MSTKPLSPLASRALATIRRHNMLSGGERVIVAVSGGPDSMALLDVLVELREPLGLRLCVAHLNHCLRGQEATEDAEFVAARADALGLPAKIGSADVAALRQARGGTLEVAARRARYAFLEAVAAQAAASRVALGHTAEDQAETILLRLLRGGELAALCGMPPRRTISPGSSTLVVRPLIEARRADVLSYLAERGVAWRADATNVDPSFRRNWVRHELLPALGARLGGDAATALLNLQEAAHQLSRAIAAVAASVPLADLAAVPRIVRREALRMAHRRAGGTGGLTWRTLDAIESLLAGGAGRMVALPCGLVAERQYREIVFRQRSLARPAVRAALTVPGRVELPELGLWLEAEALESPPHELRGRGGWEEVVDIDAVGERLEVRTRRPGDRFVPLGMAAPVKLKDFLISQHVPRCERDAVPLATCPAGIVWVVGLRLDDRAKVTPATRRFARLRAGRLLASRRQGWYGYGIHATRGGG